MQSAAPYVATRPRTTLKPSPAQLRSVIFDQLLVSRAALKGGPISLLEQSINYVTKDVARDAAGYPVPASWSDHFPLVALFRVT